MEMDWLALRMACDVLLLEGDGFKGGAVLPVVEIDADVETIDLGVADQEGTGPAAGEVDTSVALVIFAADANVIAQSPRCLRRS